MWWVGREKANSYCGDRKTTQKYSVETDNVPLWFWGGNNWDQKDFFFIKLWIFSNWLKVILHIYSHFWNGFYSRKWLLPWLLFPQNDLSIAHWAYVLSEYSLDHQGILGSLLCFCIILYIYWQLNASYNNLLSMCSSVCWEEPHFSCRYWKCRIVLGTQ